MRHILTAFSLRTTVRAASAALFCALLLTPTAPAGATDPAVRWACAGDYLSNCSKHPSDSPATRQCMRALGAKLSTKCVDALTNAGEMSRAEQERHRQAQRSASTR